MRILVTGGAGFIGSHVVQFLLAEGQEVVVLDNLSTGSITNVSPAADFIEHDVTLPLSPIFTSVRPDVVIHLAAQVSVANSVADPQLDLQVNVAGTVNVMTAAADNHIRKVVTISSAAVYGNPSALPIKESAETVPVSPYGLSKLAAEHYVRMLGRAKGVPYTILRPANVFGPGQIARGEGAVVPAFLENFMSGRDPVIHGDGSQTRDFVFVSDMVRAIRLAVDRGAGHTLNISSGTGTSIAKIWTIMAKQLGWHRPPVYGPTRAGDLPHSVMSNSAAALQLGWKPEVSVAEGLGVLLKPLAAQAMARGRD